MKLAHISLIAVLSLPSAAWAAKVENPGPHTVPKAQIGCQNLMDRMDLRLAATENGRREILARAAERETRSTGNLCRTVPAGAKVMVRKRWITQECVQIVGIEHCDCLYIENVSGQRRIDRAPTQFVY